MSKIFKVLVAFGLIAAALAFSGCIEESDPSNTAGSTTVSVESTTADSSGNIGPITASVWSEQLSLANLENYKLEISVVEGGSTFAQALLVNGNKIAIDELERTPEGETSLCRDIHEYVPNGVKNFYVERTRDSDSAKWVEDWLTPDFDDIESSYYTAREELLFLNPIIACIADKYSSSTYDADSDQYVLKASVSELEISLIGETQNVSIDYSIVFSSDKLLSVSGKIVTEDYPEVPINVSLTVGNIEVDVPIFPDDIIPEGYGTVDKETWEDELRLEHTNYVAKIELKDKGITYDIERKGPDYRLAIYENGVWTNEYFISKTELSEDVYSKPSQNEKYTLIEGADTKDIKRELFTVHGVYISAIQNLYIQYSKAVFDTETYTYKLSISDTSAKFEHFSQEWGERYFLTLNSPVFTLQFAQNYLQWIKGEADAVLDDGSKSKFSIDFKSGVSELNAPWAE